MSLASLLWLFPIVFMLHDLEEIVRVESWLRTYGGGVREKIPTFLRKKFDVICSLDSAAFSTAVAVEFLLFSAAAYLAVEKGFYASFFFFSVGFFSHTVGMSETIQKSRRENTRRSDPFYYSICIFLISRSETNR